MHYVFRKPVKIRFTMSLGLANHHEARRPHIAGKGSCIMEGTIQFHEKSHLDGRRPFLTTEIKFEML